MKSVWHNLSKERVIKSLNTELVSGLSEEEARKRLVRVGENKLPRKRRATNFQIFMGQFKSPLIYILVFAGIITLFMKEWTDTIVIFAAVFVNTIVGFAQENKASRALEKLKNVLKEKTILIREGKQKEIFQKKVVPGDIILLKSGDKIPADGRIIASENLQISEAALTGEWASDKKKTNAMAAQTPLADRENMAYMGTIVEAGEGKMVVTETGETTELGKIARLIKETEEEETPYQKKLANFSKVLGIFIGVFSLLIFLIGIARRIDFAEMFTTTIAVAVSAIPTGLPISFTIILALGMQRILKQKGLVRKLSSTETLGNASVIATDKTLTLTKGEMEVAKVFTKNKERAIQSCALCNEAFVENPEDKKSEWSIKGRPTDKALLLFAGKKGIEIKEQFPQIKEVPFNSKDKIILSLHREKNEKEKILFVSGAPESVLRRSAFLDKGEGAEKLTKNEKEKIKSKIDKMAKEGMRVVSTAYRKQKGNKIENPSKLVFTSLIGLKDPLREDVKPAIRLAKKAGLTPIIVTGDHLLTAMAAGKELGLKVGGQTSMEGKDLDKLTDKELDKKLDKINIFARVEPSHKLRIIKAWQRKNKVIAMTGDGINDAPALKKADIGVSLGSGTDVAREVSDLVLLNDGFSVIVKAIEEGRGILDNIKKVITYLLSDSFTEIILIGASVLAGLPLPLTAVQILWINLAEDGILGFALAFEPKEKDLMKKRATDYRGSLLTKEMKAIIFIIGILTDLILFSVFIYLLTVWGAQSLIHIQTFIFVALGIDSLFYLFSCKSLRKNLWKINPFSNKVLNISWFLALLGIAAGVYVPFLQKLLGTVPLNIYDWSLLFGLGLLKLTLIEMAKHYFIVKKQVEL